MNKYLICLSLFVSTQLALAQSKKQQDIAAIKSMCGCYDIDFNFAETFAPEKDYEFHDNYRSGGLEYAFVVEETDDKIVIQHLLVVGDTMIIKHWRQDWLYEHGDLYTYDKNNSWKYTELSDNAVAGQWTQKVYQVDDSPRYEGTATWVHVDDRHYWESTADAPLPRREFSKRSDYNVMNRRNRHEITSYGWLHEQDNKKIVRGEGEDQLLAYEKGWNTYTRVADNQCAVAATWWENNQAYWADVRAVWDEIFATKKTLTLNMKVDDKLMFNRLFEIGERYSGDDYHAKKARKEIRAAIQMHLDGEIKLASR